MKTKSFTLFGYQIDIYIFGDRQYMYPAFNGNAEFRVTKQGYRNLHHYLRGLMYIKKLIN